jgi:hypothetical protein
MVQSLAGLVSPFAGHAWGRDFAARIDRQVADILAEAIRRTGGQDMDLVKEVVAENPFGG